MAWSDSVIAFGDDLNNCGPRVYPVRGFWSACTRESRHTYKTDAATARRDLRRYDRSPKCRRAAAQVRSLISQVTAQLHEVLKAYDGSLPLGPHLRVRVKGRTLRRIGRRTNGVVKRDLRQARGLSAAIASNC